MEDKTQILQVNPTTFEFQQYTEQDNVLISSSRLDTAFTASTDYIEYYAYDENQNLIYPLPPAKAVSVRSFSVINGDTLLYPAKDLEDIGYDYGSYYSTYNFYRKILSSDITINYYISEISSDRTEVRLKSNAIPDELIISSSNDFIQHREEADYFVDFFLNFGNDQQVISNNLRLDINTELEPSLLVKLYEPLPPQFDLKSTLWIVEEISVSQAYNVIFPEIEFAPNDFQFIKGPNYSIEANQQMGESTQVFSYTDLVNTNLTSSFSQLNNLLKKKEINISVNYEDYNNFIYFSSAYTRLENFYYKVSLIESYNNIIVDSLGLIGGGTTGSLAYSESKATYVAKIDHIKNNFDGYEYFLYYNSGSSKSWPKSNTEPPYVLYSTGSAEVIDWLGSVESNTGQASTSSNYDLDNGNYLYYAIPEYLRSDSANQKYELFVDMVAQQYDNIWLYTKDLTNRFNADNRLDYGISKDLVADAIRNFGIKLYSNNFNTNDLYTSFLGITPSGSTFPFLDMTGSYPAPSGFEYVDNQISASNDIVPLDDTNKRLYKRIYHNLPYLLKTKGTLAGLRALITSYGIPDTVLRINEFGGQDRQNYKDWDYSQNQFNYAYHLDGTSYITSSFTLNSGFQPDIDFDTPKTLQFRFKTPGIPTSSVYYNIWVGDTVTSFITLEYTGQGMDSGSYSGSVPSQSNAYGTLKLYPDGLNNISQTASLYLPFFDGGWWSVMATVDYNSSSPSSEEAYLYSANRINDKIGFSGSNSINYNWQRWNSVEKSSFPLISGVNIDSNYHAPLTGALQEIRYWDTVLSESLFYDYVVNPYSTQGNTINSTPDDLAFRADLGTLLDTGSRISTHPKVTGSWEITQSFADNTSTFYLSGDNFIENREEIYLNQIPGGIKNKITDKISIPEEVVAEGDTLSPYRSIQQYSYVSSSDYSINYLEVAFSPTDQINDDIIAQIGAFNLGDYIGDPRQISESGYSYPDLNTLRDAYFKKYIASYDINDFIRLIKFFDNSLFKMIKDFTPANTTLSSGVVIKQNLLERNRQAPPSVSITQSGELSGTVRSAARNYQLPNSSSSFPPYSAESGSSIYVNRGKSGGVFDSFNTVYNAPISHSGQPYSGKTAAEVSASYFAQVYPGVIQQFTESVYTTLGTQLPNTLSLTTGSGQGVYNITRVDQREFYNGEFPTNLNIGINDICSTYFGQNNYLNYFYFVQFFNNITFSESEFITPTNIPQNGNSWFWADTVAYTKPNIGLTRPNVISTIFGDGLYENITDFTYSGIGSGGTLKLYLGYNTIFYCQFQDSNGQYSNIGTITISEVTLNNIGIFTSSGEGAVFLMNDNCLQRVPTNKVRYIKMSDVDSNGLSILPYILNSSYVTFNLTQGYDYLNTIILGPQTWYISNSTPQDDNNPATVNATLIYVFEPPSSDVISSQDANFYDLSFIANGQFIWEATSSGIDPNSTPAINLTESVPQGYFPPNPFFPTESFFRGWGTATYYQTDNNGNVYYVSSGIGGSTDTFGNFNTGSVEMDTDATNITSYTPPTYPWFMNATASTTQVLVASSLVGNLGQTDLQLYTGSITASSVPIGPVWDIYDPPAAIEVFPTLNNNIVPVQPTVLSIAPTYQDYPATQGSAVTYTVVCNDPLTKWKVYAYVGTSTTLATWVLLGTTTPSATNPYPSSGYREGNGTFAANITTNTSIARTATLKVVNTENAANFVTSTISQAGGPTTNYWLSSGALASVQLNLATAYTLQVLPVVLQSIGSPSLYFSTDNSTWSTSLTIPANTNSTVTVAIRLASATTPATVSNSTSTGPAFTIYPQGNTAGVKMWTSVDGARITSDNQSTGPFYYFNPELSTMVSETSYTPAYVKYYLNSTSGFTTQAQASVGTEKGRTFQVSTKSGGSVWEMIINGN
jgi:hypothetical protein